MNQSIENNLTQSINPADASENLGIKKLQKNISNLYDLKKPEEIERLAIFLIQQLADSLELMHPPIQVKDDDIFFSSACFPSLPIDFPQSAEMPLYLYGDKVCHESIENYGIVIGRFYAFDDINKQWQWKYHIYTERDLSLNSISPTNICWEKNLQAFE